MKITLEVDTTNLLISQELQNAIKMGVQNAMANRFATVVDRNFGNGSGEDRPEEWQILTKKYADEYKGTDRTPNLQLKALSKNPKESSKSLQSSIEVDEMNLDESSVFTNNPYAMDHQIGKKERNLPARPFFPISEDGVVTDCTTEQCLRAAEIEINRVLSSF